MSLLTRVYPFVMKTKIYIASMMTAKATFQELWENTKNLAFA
jgi:hypothetical protein